MSTPNVEHSEIVYRQIGPGGNPIYFDPTRRPPIHRSLFIPNAEDTDGLSLIRSRFRAEIWCAHRMERPAIRFRLAVLTVAGLVTEGRASDISDLRFEATEDSLDAQNGEPWAHCIAVTINRTDYDRDEQVRKRIKEWAKRLQDSLTASEVLGPFSSPDSGHSYRPS